MSYLKSMHFFPDDVLYSGFKLGNPGVFLVSLDELEFSS